mmetsp:Transcript_101030/g.157842  ORF Transcript_101030/g.157842 Transcript_101030/m.157842 type:complete len:85 (-) Transcript_101030:685-939(-)
MRVLPKAMSARGRKQILDDGHKLLLGAVCSIGMRTCNVEDPAAIHGILRQSGVLHRICYAVEAGIGALRRVPKNGLATSAEAIP